MASYIALLRKDRNSDYGVEFPDFPGCVTAGATLDEARKQAQEALAFHVEGMLEDGDPIPEPSTLDQLAAREDLRHAVPFLVELDLARLSGPAQRINITVPERALRRIDAAARKLGETRSAYLVRAALKQADAVIKKKVAATAVRPPRSSRAH
ncbi:MAG TPA: type II toxin-antitoxin system HicB family antitoxin [Nevskiales bacterium]|nr:type II toxin-antitoxin system HicB family antitoxin [Nevskiales bacterium]